MSATLSPATLARLDQMRRDRRIQSAIFAAKALGPLVVLLGYLWVVTR